MNQEQHQEKLVALSKGGVKTYEQPYTKADGTEGTLKFHYDRRSINRVNVWVQLLPAQRADQDPDEEARDILTQAIDPAQATELGDLLTDLENQTLAVDMLAAHSRELVKNKVTLGKPIRS